MIKGVQERCRPTIRFENFKILLRKVHIVVPVKRWDRNGTSIGSLFLSFFFGLDKIFLGPCLSL
jgi:hypothetical protein